MVSPDPDFGIDVPALVRRRGYPIERHAVITADGYNLTTFRIPHGIQRASESQPVASENRPVALLQHGALDSSFAWVANSPNQSLAFLLADAGFDVWLPNTRGSAWSQSHARYPPRSAQFWNFSFDEVAAFGLPANVAYARNVTGAARVGLVAHSEGATTAFAALSTQPALGEALSAYVALAPPVFMQHVSRRGRHPLLHLPSPERPSRTEPVPRAQRVPSARPQPRRSAVCAAGRARGGARVRRAAARPASRAAPHSHRRCALQRG